MGDDYLNPPDQPQYPSTVLSNAPADPTALLNQAKAALQNAGYAGAECRTEKVYTPDGNFYTQNICSAPGYTGGDEANLVLKMTPQQLAAQRAYELAAGAGSQPSYFQLAGNSPSVQTSNYTGGAAAPPPTTPAAVPSAPVNKAASIPSVSNAAQQQPASGSLMPANGSVTAGGAAASPMSSISGLFSASVSIAGYSVPLWAIGASLLALPFLMGGRR